MRIIFAACGNGYCGCDQEEIFFYPDNESDVEINGDVYNWACDNAESFAHCHFGWAEEYTDEEYDDYIENYVTYDWRDITYEEYLEWCENWNYEPKSREELGK